MGQQWHVENEFQAKQFCQFVMDNASSGLTFEIKRQQRTSRQNSALHAYLSQLADTLNAHGLDCRTVLADGHPIPWSKELCKEHLWRPVQAAIVDCESTADLTTDQVGRVYTALSRRLADKFGVDVPFGNEPPTYWGP